MAWPTHGDVGTSSLDESTDSPSVARIAIHDTTVMANRMKNERGTPNGVCELDGSSLVPLSRIPVVGVTRGGTGGTTQATGRSGLGLGSSATLSAGGANGAATLNSNSELVHKPAGFAAASNGTVPVKSGGSLVFQAFSSTPPVNSVGQAELKDALGEVFATLNSAGTIAATLTLPGGQFGFYPQTRHAGSDGSQILEWTLGRYSGGGTNTNYETRVSIRVGGGFGVMTGYVQQRYFTSSPPYDLGDGPVAAFFFVDLNEEGVPVAGYMAQDPPWVYSGPTDCRPARICPKTGTCYAHEHGIPNEALALMERIGDPAARAELLTVLRCSEVREVEITQERKARDMQVIPTPFSELKPTAVLLDPMGDAVRDLEDLRNAGQEILPLLERYITIGQDPLKRAGPPGVPVVSATWKNTRT